MFWTKTPRAWAWSRRPSRVRPRQEETIDVNDILARKWRRMGWGPTRWIRSEAGPAGVRTFRSPLACLVYIIMVYIYENHGCVKRNVTIATGAPPLDPPPDVPSRTGHRVGRPGAEKMRQSAVRVSLGSRTSPNDLPFQRRPGTKTVQVNSPGRRGADAQSRRSLPKMAKGVEPASRHRKSPKAYFAGGNQEEGYFL